MMSGLLNQITKLKYAQFNNASILIKIPMNCVDLPQVCLLKGFFTRELQTVTELKTWGVIKGARKSWQKKITQVKTPQF